MIAPSREPRSRRLRALAPLVALLLVSCGPDLEEHVAQVRAAGEARIARLASLATAVRDAPRLTRDGFDLGDGEGPLDFSDWDLPEQGVSAVLWLEELEDLPGWGPPPPLRQFTAAVRRGASLVRHGRADEKTKTIHPEAARRYVDALLRLRYVLVIRTVEWTPPAATGLSYRRGRLRAEALLVDVDTGALRGGFRFQVANGETLTTTSSDADQALLGDLKWSVRRAIRVGVARHAPDAVLPFGS